MMQRQRKLVGTMLLIVLIAVYALAATAIYLVTLQSAPTWVMLLYFAIAGLGWGLPAAWLIRWMARPD